TRTQQIGPDRIAHETRRVILRLGNDQRLRVTNAGDDAGRGSPTGRDPARVKSAAARISHPGGASSSYGEGWQRKGRARGGWRTGYRPSRMGRRSAARIRGVGPFAGTGGISRVRTYSASGVPARAAREVGGDRAGQWAPDRADDAP